MGLWKPAALLPGSACDNPQQGTRRRGELTTTQNCTPLLPRRAIRAPAPILPSRASTEALASSRRTSVLGTMFQLSCLSPRLNPGSSASLARRGGRAAPGGAGEQRSALVRRRAARPVRPLADPPCYSRRAQGPLPRTSARRAARRAAALRRARRKGPASEAGLARESEPQALQSAG